MASRALLAPPGARRGVAASTPQTCNARKPSEHRRGRNWPGVLKLPLPMIAGAALFCAAAAYQASSVAPGWPHCTLTARPMPAHPAPPPVAPDARSSFTSTQSPAPSSHLLRHLITRAGTRPSCSLIRYSLTRRRSSRLIRLCTSVTLWACGDALRKLVTDLDDSVR